jgi:UDP-galactopyranose mutase
MITINKLNSTVFIQIIDRKIIWFLHNYYKNIHKWKHRVITMLEGKRFMWVISIKRINNLWMNWILQHKLHSLFTNPEHFLDKLMDILKLKFIEMKILRTIYKVNNKQTWIWCFMILMVHQPKEINKIIHNRISIKVMAQDKIIE